MPGKHAGPCQAPSVRLDCLQIEPLESRFHGRHRTGRPRGPAPHRRSRLREEHRRPRLHQEPGDRGRQRPLRHRAHDAGVPRQGGVRARGARAGVGAGRCRRGRGHHDGEHARPPRRTAGRRAAGRPQRDRGRLRQGRRGQEHGRHQPRARARRDGCAGRTDGRGRVRPVAPAPDGRARSSRGGRASHPPQRSLRPEAHVHGLLPDRRLARHLARPDGARADRSVPARRRLGRARLPGDRPAAGDRRRRS